MRSWNTLSIGPLGPGTSCSVTKKRSQKYFI